MSANQTMIAGCLVLLFVLWLISNYEKKNGEGSSGKAFWWVIGVAVLGMFFIKDMHTEERRAKSASSRPSQTEHYTPSSRITSSDESVEPDGNGQFKGYACTSDCSGHKAGYEWAEEKGISDVADCDRAAATSNSLSFGEGCTAFVEGK